MLARKSTGGKAPRKQLFDQKHYVKTFQDHDRQPVTSYDNHFHTKLSHHLYTLRPMKESQAELGKAFLNLPGIIDWGNARNYWPRVDVYSPQASIEACMEHHRKEKRYRNCKDPHIVPTWAKRDFSPYRNVIFITDQDSTDWNIVLEKGLICVQFDQDIQPEKEYDIYEAEDLLDPRDEGLIEKVLFGKDPNISRVFLRREDEIWIEEERQDYIAKKQTPIPHRQTLYHVWADLTLALWDCTYRRESCYGCWEGFEHTECPNKQYVLIS